MTWRRRRGKQGGSWDRGRQEPSDLVYPQTHSHRSACREATPPTWHLWTRRNTVNSDLCCCKFQIKFHRRTWLKTQYDNTTTRQYHYTTIRLHDNTTIRLHDNTATRHDNTSSAHSRRVRSVVAFWSLIKGASSCQFWTAIYNKLRPNPLHIPMSCLHLQFLLWAITFSPLVIYFRYCYAVCQTASHPADAL